MLDRTLKFLNCEEELDKSIPIFKEAFFEYYGEEYRQEIEESFNKAKFIGYQGMNGVERTLREFYMIKTSELIQDIIKKHNLSISEKELTGMNSFEYINIQPINEIISIVEDNELGPEGRLKKSLNDCLIVVQKYFPEATIEDMEGISKTGIIPEKYQSLPKWVLNNITYYTNPENIEESYESDFRIKKYALEKINPDINEDNFKEALKKPEFIKYLGLKTDYQKAYEEYKEAIKKVEKYQKEVADYEKLEERLGQKYRNLFALNNLDIIPEEKRAKVKEVLENNINDFEVKNYTDKIYGFRLNPMTAIFSFCSEFEEVLNNPDEFEWRKNQIKEDRIKYFKANGIDLGNDYDAYLNSEKTKRIWPSTKRIDELLKSMEYLKGLYKEELYENIERYKKTLKEIEELDLLDKNIPFNKSIYDIEGTFVSPNVRKTDNGYEVFSVVAISFNDITSNHLDHYIVHELNHLFEMHLNSVLGNTYDGISGWDTFSEEENDDYSGTKRNYELFNEIINELIAQEISAIMHRDNTYVFDDPEDSSYIGITSYEHTAFLVRSFFEEYKDLIIKSRHNGNINIILDAVGKDNFEELNGLFKIYEKEFPESKMFRLSIDLNNNEDTELTRIFYDLVDRRDKILENMHNYYESHLEKEKQL